MSQTPGKTRPLSFYFDILVALAALLIALLIVTGGIDLKLGPLRIQLQELRWPAVVLLGLLVLRRGVRAGEKGEKRAWQEAFFGPADSPTERWRAVEVLFGVTALYVLFVGSAAVARHGNFDSAAMSLGLAAQAAWNSVHGAILATSLGGGSYLGEHFSPVMALVSQGHRIWETPVFLLRLQSLMLALGAWPVYMIARQRLEDRRWALALALLYAAHPAVRGADLAGFHPAMLGVAPFLLAFYLLDERRRWGGYLFLLFAVLCAEVFWLAAALLGLYICIVRGRWREGLFLLLPAFYGFIFIVTFVLPRLGGAEGAFLGRYTALGSGTKEILGSLFLDPAGMADRLREQARVGLLRDLFAPLAFIPLLGPLRLLFGLPLLFMVILADDPLSPAGWGVTAAFLPFLFAGAAAGLGRLKSGKIFKPMKLLSGPFVRWALLILPLVFFGVSPAVHFAENRPEGYREGFIKAASKIPVDASLAAGKRLVPHFAHRPVIYLFPSEERTDYVIVEPERDGRALGRGNFREAVVALVEIGDYGVLYRDDFFIILAFREGDRSPAALKDLKSTL